MTNEELWVVIEATENATVWAYGPMTRQRAWDLEDTLQAQAEENGSGSVFEAAAIRPVQELTG